MNVSVISPAVGDLFAKDVFSISQACAYPMSGERDEFWILYFDVTADSYIAMASSKFYEGPSV